MKFSEERVIYPSFWMFTLWESRVIMGNITILVLPTLPQISFSSRVQFVS
ncbi:MAG: hypothetical protein MjAS7_2295 [Metallosphaera javensis (ex Sakai et al. 2022)]|nr:MAG: hypothetical protein MjAS7_0133 [Metallosphaera javensis (ex Sakai et al. 2022)]BCS91569.1 MAG: hypothetical protein MjAS7_0177 [Metallosphaera javensis (ex Sakai et al. 2022)]BCS92971.1 MAG: hypothetical protein MjAS7_1579 [Metallosphaera javensis (ex Sakai et al. 2022)]BCS93021.1 MAG: hypothetical protein MjAS7_1629 [Metallosphaera javensis (ex Sakai et al. 2022)]BCS93207.1 MAG: hypothetical protein MjAS7_1815 [Metallosphaera javensis (ex Sakai et al. 2022)]